MSVVLVEVDHAGRLLVMPVGGVEYRARVAAELKAMTPAFTATKPAGGATTALTWAAVVQLSATFGPAVHLGDRVREWVAVEGARRAAAGTGRLTVEVPAGLMPRPYQVVGARLIADVGRVLISDEPGTGKTITSILGVVERHAVIGRTPTLVVCPASVMDAWVTAWSTWAPGYRPVAWRGTPAKRAGLVGTADVYIASYGTVSRDHSGPLKKLHIGGIVIDECHKITDPDTAQSRAVRALVTRDVSTVVELSGTPIRTDAGNLWPSLCLLMPGAYPARSRFVTRYCLTSPGAYGAEIAGLNTHYEPELRASLIGQTRRVAKADVLSQLPPKIYSVRTVDMPAKYRKAYQQMESDMFAELPDNDEPLSALTTLAKLTRLRQLASAAADITVTHIKVDGDGREVKPGAPGYDSAETRPKWHVRLKSPSWRVAGLLEILNERRGGTPTVVFSESRQLLELAGTALTDAGYRVGYVKGGQSAAARTADVDAFQRGDLDALLLTTGAGGTGLTLTAADCVVFLERPWPLVDAMQAEDRCHRIGSEQHESIEIIDIVVRDTIDQRVFERLREKAGQLAEFAQDPRIVAELLGGTPSKQESKHEC